MTSTAQKAIEWVVSLRAENFVGTESRLITIFRLLNELVEQSDADPERRIRELERRKAELEAEIELAKQGVVRMLEPVQIKERFVQAMQISREILSDFRAVEQNFRELNRSMREKIAGWNKGKGELLEDFFFTHDGIYESDQGKSFQAFLEFLMSRAAQEDFEETVKQVCALEPVKELSFGQDSQRIVWDWIAGSKHVQTTIASISEQLRRYVDENFLEEERRINQIIKNIEAAAIGIADCEKPQGVFVRMDSLSPELSLPFDRPLFTPPVQAAFAEMKLEYGDSDAAADSALYSHISVDRALLNRQIDSLLEKETKITLAQVVEAYPIQFGLAELVAYLVIAQYKPGSAIQTDVTEPIFWEDAHGIRHRADFGRITYSNSNDQMAEARYHGQ